MHGFEILVSRDCCQPIHAFKLLQNELKAGTGTADQEEIECRLRVQPDLSASAFEIVCSLDGSLLYSGAQENKFPTGALAARIIRNHVRREHHDDGSSAAPTASNEPVSSSPLCAPCEGGQVPVLTDAEAAVLMASTGRDSAPLGWQLADGGRRLRRFWNAASFSDGVAFFSDLAELADRHGHHPELHLAEYRRVQVDLWTFAVGGLTENDFIMARLINELAERQPSKFI